MTPISDKPFIDKSFFTLKNIGVVILFVFSCASAWGSISHRQDKGDLRDDRQDEELKKMDQKLDKKVYNSDQLTYRLNSGAMKIINEQKSLLKELGALIHEQEKNNVREAAKTDYMLVILKELKEAKK